jgi:hypothetical protein
MVFKKIVWFDKKNEFLTLLKYFVQRRKKKAKTKTKIVNYN